MDLIIGGAYQGKLECARKIFHLSENDVFACDSSRIDFSKRCIDKIEEFTYCCVLENTDPVAYFKSHREQWNGSILICRDIFCGVVPMGADMRAWRQVTGQLCRYLAAEADSVRRIFCGLEQRLK